MLRTLTVAFTLLLAVPGAAVADPAADTAALTAIPQAFGTAWARGDAVALGALFAEDGEFVNVGGNWFHGRKDFVLYHGRLLAGRFKGAVITPLEVRLRFVRPDLGLIHWSWRMTGDRNVDGSLRPPRFGLMSMLAEKRRDGWLVLAAQNTNAGPGNAPEREGIDMPIRLPPNPPER